MAEASIGASEQGEYLVHTDEVRIFIEREPGQEGPQHEAVTAAAQPILALTDFPAAEPSPALPEHPLMLPVQPVPAAERPVPSGRAGQLQALELGLQGRRP